MGGDGGSSDKKRKGKEESKRKYEENRTRNFLPKWREEYKWLEYNEEQDHMFCTPCRHFEKDSIFVTGTNNYRIEAIKQHAVSVVHMTCTKRYDIKLLQDKNVSVHCSCTGEVAALSSVSNDGLQPAVIGPLDIAVRKLNEDQRKKLSMIVFFNTVYFVAKRELPFSLYPDLLKLQSQNGVDPPSSYLTIQACRRFMEFILETYNPTRLHY
ncbi:hypothetical protein DPMN_017679 [Dreissena polymorpha]|uniref:TTF-type domain-containing protein n=1 Tax=Dreissena polymorpha TaxID=45954 RepID=A0A9D4NHZ5_DREPO|nr:hypothetical protein DPMN_017679 [Dreissena polymorpha]